MRSLSSASSTSMRWRSMASRRLSSAASIASVRAISRPLVSLSARMRSAATVFSCTIRAASIASREAMSASSIARLRAISSARTRSSWRDARGLGGFARGDAGDFQRLVAVNLQLRVACSAAMRSAARLRSRAIRAASTAFCASISASCTVRTCWISIERVRSSEVMRSTLTRHGLGDAGLFGGFACRDLGFVDGAGALDLAPPGLLLVGDAGVGDGAVLLDAGFLDCLPRRDLGFLNRAGALDVALAHLAFGGDPRGVDRALVGDPRLLDLLAGQQLLFLDRAGALDLALARFALGGDARFRDGELIGDARLLDRLARRELRLFGFGLAQRALARHFGALQRAAHLDVALLFEARGLAFPLDFERLPFGVEIAGADLDHRVLLDVVAQLALGLDVLHQPGQTFGVEPVRRIEEFQVGLVEVGDRDRFQLEAVLGQRFGGGSLDARDVFAALLVHLLHGHFRGDRADRGDELAGQQRVQLFGFQRSPSERRGGDRDRFARRLHADVEVGLDVDAHAVPGDDRVLLGAGDAHRQHVHVDRREVVDEGQHEGAAIDHHPLAEEAGADEGDFLRRAMIEPVDDVDADHDRDDRDDQPEDQLTNQNPRHLPTSLASGAQRAPIALNFRT